MQANAERAAVVPVLEDCCSAGIKRVLPVVQAGVSCRRVLPEYPSAVGFVQQADEVVESVGLTVIGAYADDVEVVVALGEGLPAAGGICPEQYVRRYVTYPHCVIFNFIFI